MVRPEGTADGGRRHPDAILVIQTLGADFPVRRRRRKAKPKAADNDAGPSLPLTRLTVIESERLEGEPEAWLKGIRGDSERRDELVRWAFAAATRAIAARRVAAAESGRADPTAATAAAVRIGYGDGNGLVDGKWEEAIDLPIADRPRGRRVEALRPQERFAAILGGHELPRTCEELLLRARSDIDAARAREAALQMRVGLEAILADRDALDAPGQDKDFTTLTELRSAIGDAANAALAGPLSPEQAEHVAGTLAICERVLRRKAASR